MRQIRTELTTILNQTMDICRQNAPDAALLSHEPKIRELLEAYQPSMMFYGQYNAGKSTLLNALLSADGKEIAAVSASPCTSAITEYKFGEYTVFDTPGIDAPVEHERISRKHLEKTHIIVFVLSTAGSFDERQTIEELVRLYESKRPLIIVLNNKTASKIDSPEVAGARTQLLRHLATATGNPKIAQEIEVLVVNANTAVKARQLKAQGNSVSLQKADILLEASNIKLLQDAMLRALAIVSVNGNELLRPALLRLEKSVAATVTALQNDTTQSDEARVQALLYNNIIQARSNFIDSSTNDIKTLLGNLASDLTLAVMQGATNESLKPTFDNYLHKIADIADANLHKSKLSLQHVFEQLANTNPQSKEFEYALEFSMPGITEQNTSNLPNGSLNPQKLATFISSPAGENLIKQGFLQLRAWKVPGFKGRWSNTLGKWAGTTGRVAGAAIPLVFAAADIASAHREQQKLEEQKRLEHAQLRSASNRVASDLERDVLRQIIDLAQESFHELESTYAHQKKTSATTDKNRQKALQQLASFRLQLAELNQAF